MEISLDEIIKSINSETNNKSPGNDGFTAESYKHFSKELARVLLEVYDSWAKLGTMGVTSRTGIICHMSYMKKVIKKYCKLYTHFIFKLRL